MEPPSDIKELIFSFLISEQKLYYPRSRITWVQMFCRSIADGWVPGIAASWWRVPKLRYAQFAGIAVMYDQVEILKVLYKLGFEITQYIGNLAAYHGSLRVLRWCLPNLDATTLLNSAAEGRNAQSIKLIHSMQPDVDMDQAFAVAVLDQSWPMILLYISYGYQPRDTQIQIITSDIAMVYFCQSVGCLNLWASTVDAARNDKLDVLKMLYQADMNMQVLMVAGIRHLRIITWLIANGAIVDGDIVTEAAACDCVATLEVLPCDNYENEFAVAAYHGSRNALVWMRDKNVQDYDHAMYSAAQNGNRGIMRLLRYWNPGNYVELLVYPFSEPVRRLVTSWSLD